MKKMVLLFGLFLGLSSVVKATPISVDTDAGTFILPLQVVNGTQLYSFKHGRGFPALETVLWGKGRYQFTAGAAAVLGTDANVPFVSLQHRLNPGIFDTGNNDLQFGLWVGRPSHRVGEVSRTVWGIKASTELW